MYLTTGFPRPADGAARYLVVGALFAASLVVLIQPPSANRATPPPKIAQTAAPHAMITPASNLALAAAYGNLPLRFEANQGQADPRVKFLARGSGSELFLANTEAVLVLTKRVESDTDAPENPQSISSLASGRAKRPARVQSTALRFSLVNANSDARVSGLDRQPGTSSYFIGNDPNRWVTAAPNYSRVKYRGVYAGVDLQYYGSGRNLEFDFDIAPQADPSQIRLKIDGAKALTASTNGDVAIATASGDVRLNRPEIYQLKGNQREKVEGNYVLAANNEIMLELGPYDHNRALIFDPVIQYSTFLGGTTSDAAYGIFVDTNGNAYITGSTSSTDFPTTVGVLQSNLRSTQSNAFVSKLSANGAVLLYSTYLGGTGATGDFGDSIAVDSQGNAYVVGSTSSSDFPTVNPFQATERSAATNAFVAKLNPSAGALLYSTFLGGTGTRGDFANGVAVDSTGSAYVVGSTSSGDFPLQGAIQGAFLSQSSTGFVTKFSPDGSSVVYSTVSRGIR